MAGLSASEVAILLKAQDAASPVIQKVSGELNKLGDAGSGFGSKLKGAADTIAGLTTTAAVAGIGGLAAALTGAVTAAAGFEQQMSAIRAVSGASASELAALEQAALDLGANTSFSAREAAEGIEELVKAGVSIQDVIGGAAAGALSLAAAGGVKVAEAAELASNAMNVFGLKGADMAHVADVIAGAANASAISVTEYRYALAASGAVAATVGVNFEDLSTAIALMGNAGIKGSDAGTSLKTMLLNLSPSSKAATTAMRELGIITKDGANQFFTAEGKAKSLAEIAGVLQQATAGLTEEQRLNALQTIFGTDAIRAAAVMAKAGAAGFTELAASIAKVTADEVARERLNNFAGSLEQLKGSVGTAAITVGKEFLPVLKDLTDTLTGLVNGTLPSLKTGAEQAAATFRSWLPTIKAAVLALWEHREAIGQLVAALAGLGILITIASWVGTLTALLNPLGLALLAVTVAAAVLGAAWATNWSGIRDKTAAAWAQIQPILTQLVDWLGTRLKTAVNDLSVAWGQGWDAVLAVLARVGTDILAQLAKWGRAFVEWVTPYIGPMLTTLWDLAAALGSWIVSTALPFIITQLVQWGQAFMAWIAPMIPPMLAALGAILVALGGWIIDTALPAIIAQLTKWGAAFIEWVAPQIPPLLAALAALGTALLTWAGEQIPPLLAQLLLWGKEFVAWVAPQIPPMLAELGKLWVKMQEWVIDQVPGIVAFLTKWGILFGAWVLTTAIPELLKNLPKIIVEFGRWALSVHAEIARLMIRLGVAIVDGIWQGFQQAWPTIWERMKATLSGLSLSIPIRTSGSGNSAIQFRANGGPVARGQAYMVGERGPELFVPNVGGRIETMQAVAMPRSPALAAAGVGGGDAITINVAGVGLDEVAQEIVYRLRTNASLRGNRRW